MAAQYDKINETLKKLMETQGLFWRKGWKSPDLHARNPLSGSLYHGLNMWILLGVMMERGYSRNLWVTFKQVEKMGGRLENAKGMGVPLRRPFLIKKTDDEGKEYFAQGIKIFFVFNIEHVTGIEFIPSVDPSLPALPPAEAFRAIVDGMPNAPKIVRGDHNPCYAHNEDVVYMPADEYWLRDGVVPFAREEAEAHELGHAAGNESRTGNGTFGTGKGTPEYWLEELKAELTSVYLMTEAGINTPQNQENSAAYLKGYLMALESNPALFVTAARDAETRVAYILNQPIVYNESKSEEDAA